ncbi:hypothetical protein [Pedobacter hiemivivus]|uniref:Uncharacterized protein n=1 Tax=Pedobacter hiemivivus TaxID=2530454 RepID=A0A4R0NED0_9SPHI|nr:hypothetical protein [Pedobacter hiemivivus]TCC98799.1 hypothetical protein EZ444_05860 [Pedobacter hiemivivus]
MRNQDQKTRNYSDQASCAHAWAHQLTPCGKASNFFFDGASIYSYGRHFPIATLDGNRAFFTTRNYSVSTSAHKSLVRSAISDKEIIYVQFLPVSDEKITSESPFIKKNVDFWIESITSEVRNFLEKPKKTLLLKSIDEQIYLLQSLVRAFSGDASQDLITLLESPVLKQAAELITSRHALKEIRDRKRNASRLVTFEKSVLEWENGIIGTLKTTHPIDPNLSYLRLGSAKDHIETSKGIKVPLQEARYFWMYICQMMGITGMKHTFRILNFQVQEINPEFIRVGCHTIPVLQINKIARQLEWISTQV